MPKIAIATYSEFPNLTENDRLLIPIFEDKGYEVTAEIWDNPDVNWIQYDAVLIRSTWDYFQKIEHFKTWIEGFRNSETIQINSPEIILKNAHKFYLNELSENGIQIIPTIFSSEKVQLENIKVWDKVVIKPAVSAGSHETEVFETKDLTTDILNLKIKDGDWLIQPFMKEIQEDGEISMIFFGGTFSHAIQKVPKTGNFRVQKQFGANYIKYEPDKDLQTLAKNIVEIAGKESVYARVDGIKTSKGFLLMEIEMIEPDLFFNLFTESCTKFCDQIIAYLSLKHETK